MTAQLGQLLRTEGGEGAEQDHQAPARAHAVGEVEDLLDGGGGTLAYLQADGIEVQARRGPSGDLLGYTAGRPGDLNEAGEQIFHPGGKIAPDLSLPKIKARLESSRPEEHPTARRNRPNTPLAPGHRGPRHPPRRHG